MATKEKITSWYEIIYFNGQKEITKASDLLQASLYAHKEAREQKTIVRSVKKVNKLN
jgi:hypothetical protein